MRVAGGGRKVTEGRGATPPPRPGPGTTPARAPPSAPRARPGGGGPGGGGGGGPQGGGGGGGDWGGGRRPPPASGARPRNQRRHARRVARVALPQRAAQRALLEPRLQHHAEREAGAETRAGGRRMREERADGEEDPGQVDRVAHQAVGPALDEHVL